MTATTGEPVVPVSSEIVIVPYLDKGVESNFLTVSSPTKTVTTFLV